MFDRGRVRIGQGPNRVDLAFVVVPIDAGAFEDEGAGGFRRVARHANAKLAIGTI